MQLRKIQINCDGVQCERVTEPGRIIKYGSYERPRKAVAADCRIQRQAAMEKKCTHATMQKADNKEFKFDEMWARLSIRS